MFWKLKQQIIRIKMICCLVQLFAAAWSDRQKSLGFKVLKHKGPPPVGGEGTAFDWLESADC